MRLAAALLTCALTSLQVLLGKPAAYVSSFYCGTHKQVESEQNSAALPQISFLVWLATLTTPRSWSLPSLVCFNQWKGQFGINGS